MKALLFHTVNLTTYVWSWYTNCFSIFVHIGTLGEKAVSTIESHGHVKEGFNTLINLHTVYLKSV